MTQALAHKQEQARKFNPTGFKARFQRFLLNIGIKNNTPPDDATAQDAALHHLLLRAEARAYFDKAYKAQLAVVIKEFDINPDDINDGDTGILLESNYYQLQLTRTNPADKFDKKKFIAGLRKKGVPADVIESCETDATGKAASQKRYAVVTR